MELPNLRNPKFQRIGGISTLIFALVFGGSLYCFAQRGLVPDKYLAIVPGISTRSDVERIFSKSDTQSHVVEYSLSDGIVSFDYFHGDCELGITYWSFPNWTVEEVMYDWSGNKRIRLDDIILDRTKFEKRRQGDVVQHDYYVNDEFGIMVVYDRQLKSVINLNIQLSEKLKNENQCRKK